jgi:hypothetical protein
MQVPYKIQDIAMNLRNVLIVEKLTSPFEFQPEITCTIALPHCNICGR